MCYTKSRPDYATKYYRQNLLRTLRGLGIAEDDYWAMLEAQRGLCAICERKPHGKSRLHIDHNHETGAFRGLLCISCNPGIGYFQDDPERLRAAAAYLESRD